MEMEGLIGTIIEEEEPEEGAPPSDLSSASPATDPSRLLSISSISTSGNASSCSPAKSPRASHLEPLHNLDFDLREDALPTTSSSSLAPKTSSTAIAPENRLTAINQLLLTRQESKEPSKSKINGPGPAVASRLQATMAKLDRNMKQDKVGRLLEKRIDRGDLHKGNILQDSAVAPMLQSKQRELMKNLAKSNLFHALQNRPTYKELKDRGIIEQASPAAGSEPSMGMSLGGGTQNLLGATQNPQEAQLQMQQQLYYQQQYLQQQQQQQFYQQQQYLQQQPYLQQQQPQQGQVGFSGALAASSALSMTPAASASSNQNKPYGSTYQRRSKNFHLTRILLKLVASMAEAGEISQQAKGVLKDLIVDQDSSILAMAECFDHDPDVSDFKNSLIHLANRK